MEVISLHVEPLTGESTDVYLEELQGKVTVVNFWGTWCPPCRLEFPHVVAMHKKYSDRDDFTLLAVSYPSQGPLDVDELRGDTRAFLSSQNTTMPTYVDPRQSLIGAAQLALGDGGFGFPTTLVLGRDTTIRGVWEGYATGMERDIEALVEELLSEPGGPSEPGDESEAPSPSPSPEDGGGEPEAAY
jgi:cytochrome c biogenesis protein CcmG/thiol:disulfide interchange protein DsbE